MPNLANAADGTVTKCLESSKSRLYFRLERMVNLVICYANIKKEEKKFGFLPKSVTKSSWI